MIRLGGLAGLRLVAGRELGERMRSRLIWGITLVTAAGIVCAIVIPALLVRPAAPVRLGLVGAPAQALAPALRASAAALRTPVTLRPTASRAVTDAVRRGRLDAAVAVTAGGVRVTVATTLAAPLRSLLQSATGTARVTAALARAGLPAGQVRAALAPATIAVRRLQPSAPGSAGRVVAAITAAALLYIALLMAGGTVAAGIAQEKTTRTAEVLLATLRPTQLLAGKVLGIGLFGLLQMLCIAAAALAAALAVGSTRLPPGILVLIPGAFGWFIGGYALYALAFAAAGALVARQEEVGYVIAPFSTLLVGGYLLTFAAVEQPDAPWVQILSVLPPLAPILMPVRLALGQLPGWQSALAVLLLLAAVAGMVHLAARVYAASLIRSGPRIGWRAALRLRP